jgi:hypothetical protein
LGGYRVNGVHGILYRITVRGSAYTQMTRERPVPRDAGLPDLERKFAESKGRKRE